MYRRLTLRDRYHIELLVEKNSARKIAKKLKVSPSTISRELKRCRSIYRADEAEQSVKNGIRARSNAQLKIKGVQKKYVDKKLRLDWSPEQISDCRKKKRLKKISIPTIYRYIEKDRLEGGKLKSRLRILRKMRKDRKKPKYKKCEGLVRDRTPIKDRPKIVEKRQRLGDYERDLVFGDKDGPALLTIVDRKSRYLHIACVKSKKPEVVHRATVRMLRKKIVHTITNDNGIEFAFHKKTSKQLNAPIFFSRAYAAWERGTNENINGLLRQYVPKWKPLKQTTWKQLRALERKLNNRPRKCLGYRTPYEIYHRKRADQVLR